MKWMLMPLRRYADFSGRSRRKEFWMFALLNLIISTALLTFIVIRIYQVLIEVGERGVATDYHMETMMPNSLMIVLFVYSLATFIPSLAVTVRGFHDQGKSGWFVLLWLVPYVGVIIVLFFMCLDGMRGDNRYGPDPKIDDNLKGVFE